MSEWRWLVITSLLAGMQVGCRPDEQGRPSLLETPRILAIQTSPAEAKPGQSVTIDILRAGPEGRIDASDVELDFCVERKPIAAPGVVSARCLMQGPSDALVPIETAPPTSATLPDDVCSVFGPKPPPPEPNQPEQRPIDPDTTGGYYQPLRALDGDERSIGFVRIQCGTTATTQENSIEFGKRYRTNVNPQIDQMYFARLDAPAEPFTAQAPVQVGLAERLQIAATWTDCADGADCSGAETYVVLDPVTNQLRTKRESIRLSWYATAGVLDRDRSGRSADESASDAQNGWVAPSVPGDYWLFVVIRDDRGGVGWTMRQLRVTE